jgi:serine/threonine protein phosphatase PrpC
MIRFAAKSETGNRNGPNEDAFGALPEKSLWFIADGMGGHGHGEVASAIVRDTFAASATAATLEPAIRASHEALLAAEREDPQLENMGSTIVAAALSGPMAHIAWVGDSRAYLLRGKKLRQLTTDHAYWQELVEREGMDEAEARNVPNARVLVRALGMQVSDVSSLSVSLRHNDYLLLCTDGLWNEVTEADITVLMSKAGSPEQAVESLVSQALANGGHDNVSAIVVLYEGRSSWDSRLENLPLRSLYPLFGGVLAALLLAALWYLWGNG